jgi:hypothetical protein
LKRGLPRPSGKKGKNGGVGKRCARIDKTTIYDIDKITFAKSIPFFLKEVKHEMV